MRDSNAEQAAQGFAGLDGHAYCELVSFRRDGTAVPTPVWFALENDRLVVKTETPSGKIRRIRNNERVQVAPCTARGHRLGPIIEARARILAATEEAGAEAALRGRYRLGRRLFGLLVEPIFRWQGKLPIYLEVVPTALGAP